MKYPGYQVSVLGKLGNTKTKVFIDVGVGDSVMPTEIRMALLATEKGPLFEEDIHLWAYPVESIFAEKLETAIARADQNSRMKDYHDILLLIRGSVMDRKSLKTAVEATFINRETKLKKLSIQEDQMKSIQRYWEIYLRAIDPEVKMGLPLNIQEAMDEINDFLENEIL
jgi:predicted nucleotidyltransferase component of viral defense system